MLGIIVFIIVFGGAAAIMAIGFKVASWSKPKDGRPSSYLQMTVITLASCGAGAWFGFWVYYLGW